MNDQIIVSRHPAAIAFIREHLAKEQLPPCIHGGDEGEEIPVVAVATADMVRGKVVYGNVPLHLASAAAAVCVIEFDGPPPRGAEYSLEDMKAAGARLRWYGVLRTPAHVSLTDYLAQGGFTL